MEREELVEVKAERIKVKVKVKKIKVRKKETKEKIKERMNLVVRELKMSWIPHTHQPFQAITKELM